MEKVTKMNEQEKEIKNELCLYSRLFGKKFLNILKNVHIIFDWGRLCLLGHVEKDSLLVLFKDK